MCGLLNKHTLSRKGAWGRRRGESTHPTYGLAQVIGLKHQKLGQDFQAYRALKQLRPHGVQVATQLQPGSIERREGRAIPERHATMLEQTMTAVRGKLPQERAERGCPVEGEKAATLTLALEEGLEKVVVVAEVVAATGKG